MKKATSSLIVRSTEDIGSERIIRGIATHVAPDRVDDIVEPMGCRFKNPAVLLWQHFHDKPIGTVEFEKPTKDGIRFVARLPRITEPGTLKDRIDEAYQSVKSGIIRSVSIGFRPLRSEPLPSGGTRFIESEIYELSLVSVAAQPLAMIDEVRGVGKRASGAHPVVRLQTPVRGTGVHARIERDTLEMVRTLPFSTVLKAILPGARGKVLAAILARSRRESGSAGNVVVRLGGRHGV